MKMATKSYKIIILLTVFILSLAFAFGFMNTSKAYAEETSLTVSNSDASDFFKLDKSFNARFNTDGLNLLVNKNNSIDAGGSKSVKFLNDLIVNDLDIKMKLTSAETSFRFDIDAHYVNGNPKEYSKVNSEVGTTYDKSIENIISLAYNADKTKVNCKVNGVEVGELALDSDGYFTLQVRVKTYNEEIDGVNYVRNYLTIGDFDIRVNYNANQKIYYQIKNIDDKAVATEIVLDFKTENEAEETFILQSVDQKASDQSGAYKQLLKTENATDKHLTLAKPRIYLNDSFYLRKAGGEYTTTKIAYNKTYLLNISSCSLLGGYNSLYLIKEGYDNILLESNTSVPNEIQFMKAGENVKFAIGGKQNDKEVVYEEFTVDTVKEFDYSDEITPVYTYDEVAYNSFLNAVLKASKEEGKSTSIGTGTDFKIPSMKDLVSDDVFAYEELTTSVSYSTRTMESSANSMQFKVNDIGEYNFFVRFGDGKNTMPAKDFAFADKEDASSVDGKYVQYVFDFEIKDNAAILVKAPAIQGEGYIGVKYTASKFTIDADGKTTNYELFYNPKKDVADADAEGWVAIPKASSVSDIDYNKDGFDYDEVKEINYDGKLSFVPTRAGSYMIRCTASSTVSPREASADTFMTVNGKPTPVKVPSNWLKNNVWSVVFLGVGTVCLIGIIVLLCIKPKEKVDED